MNIKKFKWTREPAACSIGEDSVLITTAPHTDLWQRTYYHFRNDNAPVLQTETEEKYFSFIVKTDFSPAPRLCGHQSRLFRLGDNRDTGEREDHVVPVQQEGRRLLHRVFAGRRTIQSDADLSHVGRDRKNQIRHLCLQPGRIQLYGGVHRNAAYGMRMEST